MHKDKYIFAQLVSFLDRSKFNRIVQKYDGDKYVKSFTCWNQLLVMMFAQLTKQDSLRTTSLTIESLGPMCYHLGFGKGVTRSNLSKANQERDCRIFEEFAYFVVNVAREKRVTDIFKLDGNVYAFDSTTIDLCLNVFWWARFRKHKGGVKIHTLYDIETQIPAFFHITEAKVNDINAMDEIPYESGSYYIFDRGYNDYKRLYTIHQIGAYFVIRAKTNLHYNTEKWKRRMPDNVLSDQMITLSGYYSQKKYPESIRKVIYWDEEQDREFVYLTNATEITALQVANLYKNRWQVELFFKWLKQHLRIKKFWGTNENAVRIQIYSAITAYCMVAIVQHDLHIDKSIYDVLQILDRNLTHKILLPELFDKSKIKNFKDQIGLSEPNLFNF